MGLGIQSGLELAEPHDSQGIHDWSQTTQWALVLEAAKGASGRAALERLCRCYWYPLYACVRRRGYVVEDAQDLTQAFFAQLLQNGTLAHLDPCKGKFRSFLLCALSHFLSNEWRRAHAAKRGGGQALLSLDAQLAETRYALEPCCDITPEKIYERRWALALLDNALTRLEQEWQTAGKLCHYQLLKPFLAAPPEPSEYERVALALGTHTGTVGVMVHRIRRRYRELVREEIAATVASPQEIEEEIRWLIQVLAP